MKKTLLLLLTFILSACSLSSEESNKEISHKTNFDIKKGWDLGKGAILDKKENAIKLSRSGSSWRSSDHLISDFKIPIKPNTTYTISFKSKTKTWAPPSLEVSGSYYGDNGFISNSLGTITANSKINTWEENHVYIDVPNNQEIKSFKIRILDLPKRGKDGDIWIKEVSFKEGFFTANNIKNKKSFNGSVTRIDKLGNMQIKKDGKFEPFFPIGIYTNHKREDWSIYKKQGFNIAMLADSASSIKKAKQAGLYSSMQLVQYILPVDESWIPQSHDEKIAHLKRKLAEIKNQKLSNDLLFYYIDNEFYHIKKSYTEIVDIVLSQDKGMHPLYMLNGTYGLARKYNKRVNLTGTYVAVDRYDTDITHAFVALNEAQNQTIPAVIAQINRGVGLNFRPILFGAIARGARGVAFWKDGGEAGDIKNQPWWSDLPKISKEIEFMMPLIRANHKTSWVAKNDNKKIIHGTRTVNNKAYMIISNPTNKVQKTTFKLDKLPYNAKKIKDYFSKKSIGEVNKNRFYITIQPHDSMVVQLD